MVRPDISFAVGTLASYMSKPTNGVWSTAIHIVKYLNHVVRGLAPETQVGLSRYPVTIKLCDSYCLGIGLDELVVQ